MSTTMVSAASRSSWNTLRLLRSMRALVLVLDFLLLLALSNAVSEHRTTLRLIGEHEVPGITAAQHAELALNAMDARTVNELLQSPVRGAVTGLGYEERRSEAVRAMMQAGESEAGNQSGKAYLETLQLGLGTYERLVGASHDLHTRGDAGTVPAYNRAAHFMDETLLPASRSLEDVGEGQLADTYKAQSFRSAGLRFLVGAVCLLELLALVAAQLFLSRRTHRTFNLPLVGASAVTLVLGTHLLGVLANSHRQLVAAREDAFTSVHSLWHIRETAYAADREESRYLLDPVHGGSSVQAFARDSSAMATKPAGLTPDQLVSALRERHSVDGFSGLLAAEIQETDSAEEREALLRALTAWQQYTALDAEVYRLQHAGLHEKAVQLYTGNEPGQAHGALKHFDDATEVAVSMSQATFDDEVHQGLSMVSSAELEGGVATCMVAALVVLGFAPRIREYR